MPAFGRCWRFSWSFGGASSGVVLLFTLCWRGRSRAGSLVSIGLVLDELDLVLNALRIILCSKILVPWSTQNDR